MNKIFGQVDLHEKHEHHRKRTATVYVEGDGDNVALYLKNRHGENLIDVALELYEGDLNLKVQSPRLGNDVIVTKLLHHMPKVSTKPIASLFTASHTHRRGCDLYHFYWVVRNGINVLPTKEQVIKELKINFEENDDLTIEISEDIPFIEG